MKSTITLEELARIAAVEANTVRRTAKDLFDLLSRDLEKNGIAAYRESDP